MPQMREDDPALDLEFLLDRVEGRAPLRFLAQALLRVRPARRSGSRRAPAGLLYSGCFLVVAITRGSGVTPAKALSKVARVMPLACASFHSSARNLSNAGSRGAGCCACAEPASAMTKARGCERAENHPRSLHQRDQPAAVALQAAGDLEFQQHGAHDRRRRLRQPHQVVDADRRRAEQADDAGALVGRGLGRGGRGPRVRLLAPAARSAGPGSAGSRRARRRLR